VAAGEEPCGSGGIELTTVSAPDSASPRPASAVLGAERSAGVWYGGLDVLRVVAIYEIISFHAAPRWACPLGFGLPVFLLMMNALAARRRGPGPSLEKVGRRTRFLLGTWLVWSGIYAVALFAKAGLLGKPPGELFHLRMLFYGTWIHLWFLPFAAVSLLAVDGLGRLLRRLDAAAAVGIAVGLGIAALLCAVAGHCGRDLGYPWLQWVFSFASIPLGYAIGRAASEPGRLRRLALLGAVVAATVLLALSEMVPGYWRIPVRYAFAASITCAAFAVPLPALPGLRGVSTLVLGIYLVHPLFVCVLRRIPNAVPGFWTPVAVFLLSVVAVGALRRLPAPLRPPGVG
jgi:surface polysaccharide O-acyltransferase-like enzyme